MNDDLDRRLRESLGGLPLPSAPPSLHDAIDRLDAEPAARPHPRGRGVFRAVPVLAIAIVMVAFLAWGTGLQLGASPGAAPSASSLGLATENPKPSGSIVPWLLRTVFSVPSPSPVAVPSGTPPCLPGNLTAAAGWQGATGQMAGEVGVTNVGLQACVLVGSPRLIQLRSGTTIVEPITYDRMASDGSSDPGVIAGPVLLAPGGAAGAFLLWANWCPEMIPVVTALVVTLPSGGAPIIAGPAVPGSAIGSVPRCDVPSAGSTLTGFAFTPVAPPAPPNIPQAASVALSAPSSVTAGADLVYYVTLTNLGSQPAALDPCPTYSETLVVGGRAVKLPALQYLLLNCAAIGSALAAGASVIFEMHLPVPSDVTPGPATLGWDLDPGGPFDTSAANPPAALTIVGP